MSNNGAFRGRKVYFSQVSNEALRDSELSLKAKGLYALIQSYITIENFVLYKNTLRKQCKEGEKAFEATWKELKDTGYLVQYKFRDDKGNFYYEYDLLDVKQTAEPLESKDSVQTPKKEGMDKNNPDPQKGGSGFCRGGKRGVYNDTDLNNTYIEEEDALREVCNFYSSIKDKKISSYDRKTLSEVVNTYGKAITLKAMEVMAERAEKPNLAYIKNTLKDWESKNILTIPLIEEHFAKQEVLKEDAKKNNHAKLERAAKGNIKIKKDSFNSYDQRNYTPEQLEEIAKATRENNTDDIITDNIDTKEWLKKMRNKNKRV